MKELDGKQELYCMEIWMYIEKLWVGMKSGFGGIFVGKRQYILNSASCS